MGCCLDVDSAHHTVAAFEGNGDSKHGAARCLDLIHHFLPAQHGDQKLPDMVRVKGGTEFLVFIQNRRDV